MNIRRATPDDAGPLAQAHVASWHAAYRGLVPDSFLERFDYERRFPRFRDALKAGSEETYLVEEKGEVLGFLTLGACRDEDVDHAVTGEIWGIYLAPAHWRKGVGRRLCQRGEQILNARGYTIVTLWVFEDNHQARRFYEAMGFAPDGASKILNLGAPLKAIRYRKQLPPLTPSA